MSSELSFDGKQYISSKRAAELTGYAQDYIGQLGRKGLIDARRVGGLWYVFLESLNAHQIKAESYKPEFPRNDYDASNIDTFIFFDGRQYVSAARAAKLTGYHQDYVGQLARSGKILSRQVGNRWYVDNQALIAHKEEKDRLLGAVQAQSVGIRRENPHPQDTEEASDPFFTYLTESTDDLMPAFEENRSVPNENLSDSKENDSYSVERQSIAIRVVGTDLYRNPQGVMPEGTPSVLTNKRRAGLVLGALTVVVFVSGGFFYFGPHALRISKDQNLASSSNVVINGLSSLAEQIERLLTRELTYTRPR